MLVIQSFVIHAAPKGADLRRKFPVDQHQVVISDLTVLC